MPDQFYGAKLPSQPKKEHQYDSMGLGCTVTIKLCDALLGKEAPYMYSILVEQQGLERSLPWQAQGSQTRDAFFNLNPILTLVARSILEAVRCVR